MTFRKPVRSAAVSASLALKGAALLLAAGLAATAATARTVADQSRPIAYSMEGNYLAGRFASQQADYGASADYFAEALLSDPDDPYLLERTLSLYIAAGQMDDMREYALRLREADRGNPLAALALGVDDFRRGRWSVAVRELQDAESGPLLTLAAEVLSAWSETGAGKPTRAIRRLDTLKGEKWFDFFRKYHCGLILAVTGNDKEAVRWFEEVLAIDDSSTTLIDAAARSMARAGERERARALVDKALANVPDHPLMKALADDLARRHRPAPHIRSVREGAAEILSGLGTAIVRQDSGNMGLIFLQLALSLDPGADLTRITLAEALERSKRYENAIAVLRRVDAKSPVRRNAEVMIAFDYNSLDEADQAKAALLGLLKRDPADSDALVALGNILRVRKKFDEAVTYYGRAIALAAGRETKDDWQLYYNRGIAFERTDRFPQAEADFRKALALSPDQPLVLNYLGYSWVDRGMNLDEAMAMIRKAVDLDPTDGFIVDSLGWAYYKLGDYDKAVGELEKAVDLQPGDSTINDHLGDAYWRVGRRIEARFQWNHAKAGKPEPDDLRRIEDKIARGLVDPAPGTAADAGSPPKKTASP